MSILYWVMILDIIIYLCINYILVPYLLWMKKACDKTIEPHTRHSQPLIRVPGWNSWGLLHTKSGDMHCPPQRFNGRMLQGHFSQEAESSNFGCETSRSSSARCSRASACLPHFRDAPRLKCWSNLVGRFPTVLRQCSLDFPWCWLLFDHYCSLLVVFYSSMT